MLLRTALVAVVALLVCAGSAQASSLVFARALELRVKIGTHVQAQKLALRR
jgi:hypothetical protein